MAWIWDCPPFVDEDDWRYVAAQALAELDAPRLGTEQLSRTPELHTRDNTNSCIAEEKS